MNKYREKGDRIRDMWDLIRIRRMLHLFRKCPYNGPSWHLHNDTQKIKWADFSHFLMAQKYFLENWKYSLLRLFIPFIYRSLRSDYYREHERRRLTKINKLIRKSFSLGLINIHKLGINATPLYTNISFRDEGMEFIDNWSDFLKVFLKEYGLVASFLVGLTSPAVLWLATILPKLLVEYGIV